MDTLILNGEQSRRNFAVLVSAIQSRGKSLSEAIRLAEFSFKRKQSDPVEQAKETLKENGYFVDNMWQRDDVICQAGNMDIELTDEQIDSVMSILSKHFDAGIGINWDSIESAIEVVIKED
jgi:hypothetical protein